MGFEDAAAMAFAHFCLVKILNNFNLMEIYSQRKQHPYKAVTARIQFSLVPPAAAAFKYI